MAIDPLPITREAYRFHSRRLLGLYLFDNDLMVATVLPAGFADR